MPLRCRLAVPDGGGGGVLGPGPALLEVTADHVLTSRMAPLCGLEKQGICLFELLEFIVRKGLSKQFFGGGHLNSLRRRIVQIMRAMAFCTLLYPNINASLSRMQYMPTRGTREYAASVATFSVGQISAVTKRKLIRFPPQQQPSSKPYYHVKPIKLLLVHPGNCTN